MDLTFHAKLSCGCELDLQHDVVTAAHYQCPDRHMPGQKVAPVRVPTPELEALRRRAAMAVVNPDGSLKKRLSPAIRAGAATLEGGADSGQHPSATQPPQLFQPLVRFAVDLAARAAALSAMATEAFFRGPFSTPQGAPAPVPA